MVDSELLQRLEERYAHPEVPPCRICGEELTVSSMGGGGPTIFHCGSEQAKWLGGSLCLEAQKLDPNHKKGLSYKYSCEHYRHYVDSEFNVYRHGDSDVLKLVEHVRELTSAAKERTIPLRFSRGTKVKTTQPNPSTRSEWTEEGWNSKRPNAEGVVIDNHDAHGLFYAVRHEDGTIGYYDPSELEFVI